MSKNVEMKYYNLLHVVTTLFVILNMKNHVAAIAAEALSKTKIKSVTS